MTWFESRLKHVCADSGQYGLNVTADSYSTTGRRLIRTSDIAADGELRPEHEGGVFVEIPLDVRYKLHAGDILLSRSGTLGRSLLISERASEYTFAGYLVRFRPRDSVEPRFLHYFSLSGFFQGRVHSEAISSTIQNFNAERYANIPITLPELVQQRHIADFLDAETARINRLVEVLRKTIDTLAERRAAGVLGLVSGPRHDDRRPSDLAWVDTLPSTWPEVRLGLVARMGSGHTPSRSHPEWWVDCTIPWITTGEVKQIRDDRQEVIHDTREMISDVGLANSAAELHPASTVVLSRTASAGYSAIMGRDMATSQDFVTWTCGPRLDPHYLLWCLRAMRPDLLGRLATGSTHKTIYFPDLQMLRIPLPSLQEQKDIVENIRRQNAQIDQLTDKVQRQLDLLAERRAALITAAVTGEFDVSSASGRGVTE